MGILFETRRLIIRRAMSDEQDIAFFLRLWNNPEVMKFVGYPFGLGFSPDEVKAVLQNSTQAGLDDRLIAVDKNKGAAIGECKLGTPDPDGVSETDVKLLPEYWGHGYGTEIKRSLLRYLFTETNCQTVQATPNVDNIASIRMQEAVGAKRVGGGVFVFPPCKRELTCPVHYYLYRIDRQTWLENSGTI